MDYAPLKEVLNGTPIEPWSETLVHQSASEKIWESHGDLSKWQNALDQLPVIETQKVQLDQATVSLVGDSDKNDSLAKHLMQLHPWRKGPFSLFGLHIDTEWRSDWKWTRLEQALEPMQGRLVLDVGCGNGYHCWRMAGAGAKAVLGIDPTLVYVFQYWALQNYIQDQRVWVLPLRIENLPKRIRQFDTTFSMGVLYHRRSPIEHLLELQGTLRSGGQLVLETLVLDGTDNNTLVPEGRYARMNNVWFLPTVPALESWLRKTKFRNIQVVDVSTTTVNEQRSTRWMKFESLSACLDSDNKDLTIEGHPAPVRAIITANAP